MGQSVGLPEGFKVVSMPSSDSGLPAGFKVVQKPSEPMKPTEATVGDILSRFGSPTGQPETVMEKLKRTFTSEPNVVTGRESTGNTAIDIINSLMEGSVPGTAAVRGAAAVLPSAARAGVKFDKVLEAAKSEPIDVTKALEILDRAKELNKTGNRMPQVLNAFRKLIEEGKSLTYKTGRDLASTAGRLSAQETERIAKTPMAAQVTRFAQAMKDANREAAVEIGMGPLYDAAMKEYRQAATLHDAAEVLKKYGTKAAITALLGGTATAAGYGVYKSITGR